MLLAEILGIRNKSAVISICGGGGKTSTMFALSRQLYNYSWLLTTTTKILLPDRSPQYSIFSREEDLFLEIKKQKDNFPRHFVFGNISNDYPGKMTGCSFDFLRRSSPHFDYMIIESDGSAGRPIKAPAGHEPVIYNDTDLCIGIIGLDCIGKPATPEYVHRPELFANIRKKSENQPVSPEDLIQLINHKNGLFKNAPPMCRRVALLNKADILNDQTARSILNFVGKNVLQSADVVLNSYNSEKCVLFRG